jgi:hypothetical protein
MSIIKKIKDYNKNKISEVKKILNFKNDYIIDFKNKLLTLYDNDNKILVADYIFFGIYQPNTKLWIWASSIPGVNKKNIDNINNIRKSSYLFESSTQTGGTANKQINNNEFDDNKIEDEEQQFIYQLLTQDVILIPDKNYLDLINLTLNYISDGLNILNPINEYNNIQFIGITKIIEKYV